MTDAPSAARRRLWLLLGAITLAAVLLRLPALAADGWGHYRDELNYVPKAVKVGGGDLNPGYFQNPPLASYLMFLAIGARYAAGRAAGVFASGEDFKTQFLLDGAGAFAAARFVAIVFGAISVVQAGLLARSLVEGRRPTGGADPVRSGVTAAALAAAAMAFSALHVERSSFATNETLVTCTFTLAVQWAVRLGRSPTVGLAICAGAAAGLAMSSKYTGAVAAFPVGAAILAAPGLPFRRRTALALASGTAFVAAFLATCPWAILDAERFWSHVRDLTNQSDRWGDGLGWKRYLVTAWTEGLGPVWSLFGLAGVAAAAVAAFRNEDRAARVAVLTGIAALAAVLVSNTNMAYGRYLLPAYPSIVALAAAWLVSRRTAGAWLVRAAVAVTLLFGGLRAADALRTVRDAARPSTNDAARVWIRSAIPDGARVLTDMDSPLLPDVRWRDDADAGLPAATRARLTPAYRLSMAWEYFALPVNTVAGTEIRADDFEGLRGLGDTWFVTTSNARRKFDSMREGTYPPRDWYQALDRHAELVWSRDPDDVERGPGVRVYFLRGR